MSEKVKIEDLGKEIAKIYEEYAEATVETVDKVTKEVAKDTSEELKKTAPSGHRTSKKYKDSFKFKKLPSNKAKKSQVVYSDQYQLTHLLENGHITRNGGHTQPQPHWKPAEEKAEEKYLKRLKQEIENQ